jgi:general stress protein 26
MAHTEDAHDLKHDFWLALAKSPYVLVRLEGSKDHALPMTAQLDRVLGEAHGGAIWFFTERGNRLAPGGPAMLHYMSDDHELFACVSGTIREETERAVLDKLWSSMAEAWYDGGKDDPRLLLLRMDLDDIELWEVDISLKGWFKMITGKKMRPDEMGSHVHAKV